MTLKKEVCMYAKNVVFVVTIYQVYCNMITLILQYIFFKSNQKC